MEHIPVSGPWITSKEISYVADAAANAWYSQANMYHDRFENAFAAYVGRRYAVALPSCTSAIHLALLALGIGPGDEVIVPDVTWIASAAPIVYVGATPVFADIEPDTWCLSAKSVEQCLTPRTKAMIPVDIYGGMPDWDAILELAKRNNIAVIEDSAEAIGSEYDHRKAGSFGDASVFSFHGSKTLTTGEGGLFTTDRGELHEKLLFLRDHGRRPGDVSFCNAEVAYKYKMSSLQAALGLAQLERVDELVLRKREIFSWYVEEFESLEHVTLNVESTGTRNSYWMVTVVMDPAVDLTKERLMSCLAERSIDSRPFFHPLSSIPAFQGTDQALVAQRRNEVSYSISPRAINLPSALCLTRDQVAVVGSAVREIVAEAGLRRTARSECAPPS